LSLVVIAKTGSRGTTVALFAGLATFIMSRGSVWLKLRNLVLLAVAAGAALWVFGHSEVLMSRWTETLEKGIAGGISSRNVNIRESWQMVTEKPVIGWGSAAGRELAIRHHQLVGGGAATHNMVLETLVITGFLGFLPYLWGYLRVAWASWRARGGTESTLPLALFVTLFVADMITGGLLEKNQWTFFAYILAAGTTTLAATWSRVPNGNNGSMPGRARAVR
jgi:O-antigen ligase